MVDKYDIRQCHTTIYRLLIGTFIFFQRIGIEGALLSQATKLGSNETLLNSRKKVSLEPSGLESQFQESIEPAYSSDQDENLQTSAVEQIDADDEEEAEQVGKRGGKKSFCSGEDGRGIKSICKTSRRHASATYSPYKDFYFYKYFVLLFLVQFTCILHLCYCTHILFSSPFVKLCKLT